MLSKRNAGEVHVSYIPDAGDVMPGNGTSGVSVRGYMYEGNAFRPVGADPNGDDCDDGGSEAMSMVYPLTKSYSSLILTKMLGIDTGGTLVTGLTGGCAAGGLDAPPASCAAGAGACCCGAGAGALG